MIKKINIKQLKLGMYIHDVNCTWLKHPFFGSSVKVDSEKIVEKIVKYGIKEVFIDTEIGIDVVDAPTKEEVGRKVQDPIEIVKGKPDKPKIVSIDEEIITAKKIKQDTILSVQNMMNDVKYGKQIERGKVENMVDNILDSISRNQDALIALGRLRKINDYVHSHSVSVCILMSSFAKLLGFDSQLVREVGIGAMLHDIGMAKIPQHILNRTSELNEKEFEMVKKHVDHGRILLEKTDGISEIAHLITYQHHERIDGSGYPHGLKEDEISQFGQAMAIVDVYDALTSKRCFKRKITPTEALRILYEKKGTEFNAEMVEQFVCCIGVYPVGSLVRLESGLIGFVVRHNEENSLKPVVRIVYNTRTNNLIMIPYDLDLSKPMGKGGADRIIGHESPERFELYADAYL